MSSLPSSLISLLVFSLPNSRMRQECLRMHPNQFRFSYDVYECITDVLRISYGCFESGVHGQNFESFKNFASNSRMIQELQEVTTDYQIRSIIPVQALIKNIYILIALTLDESIILDVPQFPMQNIYQSCDLGRAIGRRNVNAIQ